MGRLIAKINENCEKPGNCESQNGNSPQWIDDLAKQTGTPSRTIRDWWAAFCKDASLKLTPRQADMATRLDFFRWLDEQKAGCPLWN